MNNRFLPKGAVTGIGSLPFTTAQRAVSFIEAHSPKIPFVPELPKRSTAEEVVERALASVADLVVRKSSGHFEIRSGQIDAFLNALNQRTAEITPAYSEGTYELENAFRLGRFKDAVAVKAQIVGLITLAASISYLGKPLIDNNEAVDVLRNFLERLARWQIGRLRQLGLPVLLFFDEPCLILVQRSTNKAQLADPFQEMILSLKEPETLVGIHTCALAVFEEAMALKPDILSFDAYTELEDFAKSIEAKRFVQDGGLIALGLIPTFDDLSGITAISQFSRLLMANEEIDFLRILARQSFVTATCGLGLVPAKAASPSFELAHEISSYISKAAL